MVAISLLLVGFLGTITLINRSVGLTRVVADTYVGTYLAAEGIEVIKSMVDSNYLADRPFFNGFAACAGRACQWEVEYDTTWENPPVDASQRVMWYDPFNGMYTYRPFGTQTSFVRTVSIELVGVGARELKVTSRVEWRARGGGLSAASLEDTFYDWYLPNTSTSSTSTMP